MIYELGFTQQVPSSTFVCLTDPHRKVPFIHYHVIAVSAIKDAEGRIHFGWLRFISKYHLPIYLVHPIDLSTDDEEEAYFLDNYKFQGHIGRPTDDYPSVGAFEKEWAKIRDGKLDRTIRYPPFREKFMLLKHPYLKTCRLLVLCHVFDVQVFRFMQQRFKTPASGETVWVVTTDTSDKASELTPLVDHVITVENRGVDVYGFWKAVEWCFRNRVRADYVMKVHTKTCPEWRRGLYGKLCDGLDHALEKFDAHPELDIVFPKAFCAPCAVNFKTKDPLAAMHDFNPVLACLMERAGYDIFDKRKVRIHSSGTMFISRFDYYESFYIRSNMDWHFKKFEGHLVDILLPNFLMTRTWSHAWEEFICMIAMENHNTAMLLE